MLSPVSKEYALPDDQPIDQCLIGKIEPFDDSSSLSSYLEARLSLNHYDIAAIHGEKSISFQTLNFSANCMARNLSTLIKSWQHFPATEYRVGVLLKEGFQRIISILACLKLGVTIVPLSPEVVNQTPVILIVKDECLKSNNWVREVLVDTLLQDPDNLSQVEEIIPYRSQSNAFILHTSGSSGTAKEVMVTHKQIFNRLFWQWKYLPYTSTEVVCHRTGFMFVDNVIECLSCLLSGVTMIIVCPLDACNFSFLSNVILEYKVSWLLCVPSIFQRWIHEIKDDPSIVKKLASLRTVVSSGEMLSPTLAKSFLAILNQYRCSLVNLYGSTEVTGDVTCQVFHSEDDINKGSHLGCLSVGYPISNNRILLNRREILVYGLNVSPSCDPIFYTGDSGFIFEDRLYISGRVDDMAKINGRKIFTKEIDSIVLTHGSVRQCVTVHVFVRERSFLVTFFSMKHSGEDVDGIKSELTREIVDRRSDDYVPRLEHVKDIPLQCQSMKPDKRLLQSLAEEILKEILPEESQSWKDSNESFSEQRSVVKGVLAKHLGIKWDVLLDSMDFYEMGADSLTTVTCVSELCRKGFICSTELFLRGTTIGVIVDNILDHSLSVRNEEFVENIKENFKIDIIKWEQKVEILSFLVEHFFFRDFVGKFFKMSETYFRSIVEEMLKDSLERGCPFSIREKSTNRLLALQLSAKTDDDHFDKDTSVTSENILESFLQYCKWKVVEELNEPRLNVLIVGLSSNLTQSTSLKLLHFIEMYTIEVAQRNGYRALETVNTSDVTKMICNEHGYQLVQSCSLLQFVKTFAPEVLVSANFDDVFGHYMVMNI